MHIYKKTYFLFFVTAFFFVGVSSLSAESIVETDTQITSSVRSSVSASGSSESEVLIETHVHSQNGVTEGEIYIKESENGTTREIRRVLGDDSGELDSQIQIQNDLESIIQSLQTIFAYDFSFLLQSSNSFE